MENYTYEDVKQAYKAIIEVGRANIRFGGALAAQMKHRENLGKLKGNAKELYEKLLNDKDINY